MSLELRDVSIKSFERDGKLRGYFEGFQEEDFAIKVEKPSPLGSWKWVNTQVELNGERKVVWINKASFAKTSFGKMGMSIEKAAQIGSLPHFSRETANQKLRQLKLSDLSSDFDALPEREQRIVLATLNCLEIRDGQVKSQENIPDIFPWLRRVSLSEIDGESVLYIYLNKLRFKDRLVGRSRAKVKECLQLGKGGIQKLARKTFRGSLSVEEMSIINALRRLRGNPGILDFYDIKEFIGKKLDETGKEIKKSEIIQTLCESTLGKALENLDENKKKEIVIQVLNVVQILHEQGIIHCDLKLGNILLDKEGNIYFADFGSAAKKGTLIKARGTRHYMAPEVAQKKGKGPFEADFSIDLWSLGVLIGKIFLTPQERREFRGIGSDDTLYSGETWLTEDCAEFLRDKLQNSPIYPLIDGMLQKAPNERISVRGALALARRIFKVQGSSALEAKDEAERKTSEA